MPTGTIFNIDGQCVTNDATATTIVPVPINDNSSMRLEISVLARRPSNDDAKIWEQLVLTDKTGGGTPTIKGALTDLVTPIGDIGAATWTIQTAVDSTHILVQVKGQAGATINWFAEIWAAYMLED